MKVLKNARLIDGTGASPINNTTIVIDGDRIAEVSARNHDDFPLDAEVINVAGMTVLPGLIDCHDHLANHRYEIAHRWGLDEPTSTRHLRTAAVLRQTLEAGYTMVRDAAGLDCGFKRAIDEGLISGPRLLLTIAIISPIGGIGEAVSPSGACLDHCCIPQDPSLPSGVAETVADIRPVVRRMVRAGADAIKCATTGGASSRPGHGPKDRAFNLDELQTLVDEAHALDRKVMCHALGGAGLEVAVEARVDSIEHGTYLDEHPHLIDKMAARNIFFVPTVLVYDYHRKSPQPHVRQRALDLEEHHVQSIQRALTAGVKVVAGTDAGGYGHPANARELICLVRSGMTPMQAIQAGTSWAAECVGWEDRIGTVEKGKLADLIVVDGDPLTEIKVLAEQARVALVIKDGAIAANRIKQAR
jgi:imidazolonepropionase-like amidohydrolase